MSRRAYPYRRPHPDSVTTVGWQLMHEDGPVKLPPEIPDWDYQRDLDLECTVDVDLDKVRESAALPSHAELALTVVWTSSGSGLRMRAESVPLKGSGRRQVPLRCTILGRDSGGVLSLDVQLVIARRLDNPDPTGPRRAGSILWRNTSKVRLQGDASQFPMTVLDFSQTGYPDDAPWYLDLGTNPEAATMGSVLLMVNSRVPLVVEAMKRAGRPTAADRLILSTMRQDIVRLMIECALSNEALEDGADYEADTLGHMLLGTVHTHFPGRSLSALREMRRTGPALFSAHVQDAMRLFAKEA